MRHRKKGRHLSRTSSHRLALRRNLVNSLFTSGRIITTIDKAKEVKSFAEKIITLAKKAVKVRDTNRPEYVHKYRLVLSKIQDKVIVKKLFGEGAWREHGGLAAQYLKRDGGYTRILKLSGSRIGSVSGSTRGKVTELKYKMFDNERKIKLVGNRLGDNAKLVIFELVESDEDLLEDNKEVQPEVNVKKVDSK